MGRWEDMSSLGISGHRGWWGTEQCYAHLALGGLRAPPLQQLMADQQQQRGGRECDPSQRVDVVSPQSHPVARAAQAGPATLQAVWLAPPGL